MPGIERTPPDRPHWVRGHVAGAGELVLRYERPWSCVWKVAEADVWLKECAPLQAFEPRLTAELASRWPDRVPHVLAHDAGRKLLLLADAGAPLGTFGPPEPWLAVLALYAELQRGEAAHVDEHLAAGVPDRRPAALPHLYERMLARPLPLEPDECAKLRAFAPRFAELCSELGAAGVPNSIQHDDLHGQNVYGKRVLDWGDACVSHPFISLVVTFDHLHEHTGLRDAYLEPWGRPDELRDTFELAQRIGAFAFLFKELRMLDGVAQEEQAQFAADLPRLLRRCVRLAHTA